MIKEPWFENFIKLDEIYGKFANYFKQHLALIL